MKLVHNLDFEEKRYIIEKLPDEESLFLFDLLKKPDLNKNEINKIKMVAVGLLKTIKSIISKYEDWKVTQASKAAVQAKIHDFLYDDKTGLPVGVYSEEEVDEKSEDVFINLLSWQGI